MSNSTQQARDVDRSASSDIVDITVTVIQEISDPQGGAVACLALMELASTSHCNIPESWFGVSEAWPLYNRRVRSTMRNCNIM